jgi:uncharacterized protein
MTPAEFSFPVSDLDAGGKRLQLPVRAAWLRGVLEDTDIGATDRDGTLDLRLSKSGTDVVVRGTLAADLVVPCSRCLEPATIPVREELSALAVPGSATRSSKPGAKSGKGGDKSEGGGKADRGADKGPNKGNGRGHADDPDEEGVEIEDADVIPFDGENLILDELIRDELLLGIPMIPLCSEACAGISPERSEGSEAASIDPRLRPLLKLRDKT